MSLKVEVLEKSFQEVAPHAEEFVADFYERLLTMLPEVQHLFKDTDMEVQRTKLIGALAMVIKNLRNTRIVSMALQDLGRRHEEMDVEREHYPMVGAAILETFAGFFGEEVDPGCQGGVDRRLQCHCGHDVRGLRALERGRLRLHGPS
ncbi:MAG: globin domain-containing protein [bacterium]